MVEPVRPERETDTSEPRNAPPPGAARQGRERLPGISLLVFGSILPALVLLLELMTGFCGGVFFDPIPSVWHVLLVTAVPVTNLLLWIAVRSNRVQWYGKLEYASGAAIATSLFYAILFLPLTPIAVIAVLAYGMGLLPLSPLFALIASVLERRHLARVHQLTSRRLWIGCAVAMGVLVVAATPATLTRILLDSATSDSYETSTSAVRWLRRVGSEELLLRSCYERQGMATDAVGFLFALSGAHVSPAEAREVYYRVSGTPFNAVAPPSITARGRFRARDDFMFDPDQGGSAVVGRIKGLTLAGSSLDGSVDAEAALAYIEWTMVFRNASRVQREARAQIVLPPNGVVSRLTLWVNGEEREAAYAGRGQVREAYEGVVRRQRDPALVTTCGPDRVLLQCFPVPSDGEMKVKIGITCPLVLTDMDSGVLALPAFSERNFSVPEGVRHSLWLEARQRFGTAPSYLLAEDAGEGSYALRGDVPESELCRGNVRIVIDRGKAPAIALTKDTVQGGGHVVRQSVEKIVAARPRRVAIVIDGSSGMREYAADLADSLNAFPTASELAVIVASDEVVEAIPLGAATPATLAEASRQLAEFEFAGGCDNVRALARAWDIAATAPDSVILWIHGDQPVLLSTVEPLLQRWHRRPEGPKLLALATSPGPNKVLGGLAESAHVRLVARIGSLPEDARRLFDTWSGKVPQLNLVRRRLAASEVPPHAEVKDTSLHLARLWARDEIERLRADANAPDGLAVELAMAYRLVTPVSGAVVLENSRQYSAAGLTPVEAGTVPTIPEPETLALAAVAAIALVLFYALRRRRCALAA